MDRWFIDTSYFIALVNHKDKDHQKAIEYAQKIDKSNIPLLTTKAVIFEVGNALSKSAFRHSFLTVNNYLKKDNLVEIVPITQELFDLSVQRFRERDDKEWGLVDCYSFIVMEKFAIQDALTTDIHFQQAGFNALMR